ncbi:hypothetical protein H310_08598 [Aphanomyces invadans]|uniref:Uncharacterized protein n=1 Tax=Aphanomyces invadans TaxID=157072 RepID=A0A024TWD4_9STRA|nr:hypothetical protein H310_08598 [Aphanomyces invadans]ETV98450.1 hypothetical protein H310_08598 [Aphanomyces invadans]|eukprot:XP_008872647.1 hypothetical protein H310_08598 [Aphanomyces invadans]
MGAEEILEEDAREDWISRGFAMKDFSVKKMTAIWDSEEKEEVKRAKKLKVIQHKHRPLKEDIKHVVTKVTSELHNMSENVRETIRQFEPVILRDRRWLREHVATIFRMDEECTKYKRMKVTNHAEYMRTAKQEHTKQVERHGRIEHKAPLLRRLREMKEEADKRARAQATQELETKWKYWHDQEMEEKERYVSLTQKQNDDHIAYKRKMNMQYWKAKDKVARKEAEAVTTELAHARAMSAQHAVQNVVDQVDEWRGEEVENDEYGTLRHQTESSLGVFGIPVERGAFYSLDEGGYQPELDNHTIAFPTAGPFDTRNELQRVELMDYQSNLKALEEKVERLRVQKANTMDDRKLILDKKAGVVRGLNQAKATHRDILTTLAGPPRREPGDVERRHIHSLLKQQADFSSELKELSIRERLLTERLSGCSEEEHALVEQVEKVSDAVRAKEAVVAEMDKMQNDLPMVIGRSIAHGFQGFDGASSSNETKHGNPMKNLLPQETLTAITQRTKLELLKAAAIPAFQLYEEARYLGLESWKLSKQKMVDEAELELTVHRLAKIKDTLTKQQSLNQRSDVINALEKFHNNREHLIAVKKISTGPLDWWKSRDVSTSLGVSLDLQNETWVVLDEGNRRGLLRGAVILPSHTLWKLRFEVALLNRDVANAATFSSEDRVKVSFGMTSGSVAQIGSFTAIDDNGKLCGAHSIVQDYVGTRLYYCFEFFRSYPSMAASQKLGLMVSGTFKEDETAADAIPNAVHAGKHVLSEYVKMLRVQSQQGNHRCASLLEELIKVESSHAELWDSKVLHGHAQRFPRLTYAIHLREAIQHEISKAIQHDINKRRVAFVDAAQPNASTSIVEVDVDDDDSQVKSNSKEARLEQSMLDYRHRKSEHIEIATSAAREKVGQRIQLDREGVWQQGIILAMRVEWKEGGTKLDISHMVLMASATFKWVDLDQHTFVLLANDMAPLLELEREKQAEEQKLLEAEVEAKKIQSASKSLLEIEQDYVAINIREDAQFEKVQAMDLARREQNLRHDAQRMCTYDPQVVSLLEAEARRLMQNVNHHNVTFELTLKTLKANYIQQTVATRMEFLKKTWTRKNQRRLDKRKAERDQRKRKYDQSNQQVLEMSKKERFEKETAAKKDQAAAEGVAMAAALQKALQIPNFNLSVAPEPPCAHRELKHWGAKYDKGMRCKHCGKEMSHVVDDPDAARGADPALDRDVEKHRLFEASFRFENAAHLQRVERERLRLEKEAREMQLAEVQSYDSTHMKAIDDLNFRHVIERNVDDRDETRNAMDRHEAAYRDELSFFARVNQFRYRLRILQDLRGAAYKERLVELESLSQLQVERQTTQDFVVVIQVEQERARQLLKDRQAAIDAYNASAKHLQECLVEKTLAFRAREGVEEEAKIAMLHAEALARTSAKMRVLWEAAHADRQQVKETVRELKGQLEDAVKARQSLSERLLALQYRKKGTKVYTPYGEGLVQHFRENDRVLVIRLHQWKATVYMSLVFFVQQDKAAQQRELVAMRSIEVESRAFVSYEQQHELAESHFMEKEDVLCREIATWARNQAAKVDEIRVAVTKIELQTQVKLALTETKARFRKEAKADAVRAHSAKISIARPKLKAIPKRKPLIPQKSSTVKQAAAAMAAAAKVPPPESSPVKTNNDGDMALPKLRKQTTLEKNRLSRAALKRILMAHVEEAILRTERVHLEKYDRVNRARIITMVGESCVANMLNDMLRGIAEETIREGMITAKTMELQSTIVHSRQYPHVQPHVHMALRRQVVTHKMQLEVVKRTWMRQLERLRCVQAEVARRKEIERQAEEERKRLEALCKEMGREEMLCRKFYRDEKRMMLFESRCMQLAEVEMREYMRLFELQLMLEKYNALGVDDNRETSKQARRLQIKKGKREKQRLAEEWAAIKIEDELAMAIREVWLQERREQELEQQQLEFMLQQAEFQESDGEDEQEYDDNEDEVQQAKQDVVAAHAKELMLQLDPKARVKLEQQLERRAKAKLVATKKREEFAHRLNEEYMMAAAETMFAVANADLAVIQLQENLVYLQRLDSDAEQVKAMQIDLKRSQQQAKEITDGARRKHEHAKACIARCSAAEAALEIAIAREKRDQKFMHKMVKDTAYMDSSVLHKRCQRFLTDYLAIELYKKYFDTLVHLIVLRALTVTGERTLLALGERIQTLDTERAVKTVQVTRLWRKHTRASRMRLCRAELGRLMFRKQRKTALKLAFHGWLKVWHHSVVVRHAYELRYSLARQDQRLAAMEAKHESGSHLKANHEALPSQTILRRFQHRWIQCRLCKTMYSDAQNNRFACAYHPGKYDRACVKTCPSRRGEPLQASCMLHRAMRWLCCDETIQGAFGSTGCKRRFHVPVRDEPNLHATVQIAEAQERTKLDQVNKELVELEAKSVTRTVYTTLRDQLQGLQDDLAAKREKAARYDQYHKTS